MSVPTAKQPERKSVQAYIDETPFWADGTRVASAPMTPMQWRIWGLATAGKFFEGLVVFMTGVALPLMEKEFGLSTMEKGGAGAAPLFGILIGASALGSMADRFGRKLMFIAEMILFVLFLVLLFYTPSYPWLVVCLFSMGLALGCDYPTAHMVISESIPSKARGRLVLSAFGFQAVGALVGTAVGYLILYVNPQIGSWRWMYGTAILPAVLVVLGRFSIPDSGHWLICRRRIEQAEREVEKLLRRNPPYPRTIKLLGPETQTDEQESAKNQASYAQLFRGKTRRATILASFPWFLQDLGTYGIGIFTPTILASILGHDTHYTRNVADLIHHDMMAAKGAALLDVLLLVGIVGAVFLADVVGRIRLQVAGFVGCGIGLAMAALSLNLEGTMGGTLLLFAGFMLFNFMNNLGPNAMTYLIAGEVFPTAVRGKGAGLAASFSKVGAVSVAFLFPLLLADLGTQTLLFILVGTSLAGALLTWIFRIETAGVNLEKVGRD
ncbi:MAG: MFS transporter [Pirellulales bacterium]|nr:MFS transporter [Pirellulales bacterium]